jgi:hypothetical protein
MRLSVSRYRLYENISVTYRVDALRVPTMSAGFVARVDGACGAICEKMKTSNHSKRWITRLVCR